MIDYDATSPGGRRRKVYREKRKIGRETRQKVRLYM